MLPSPATLGLTLKGVKEMLKEVQEVKVGGRTRRVYVRPFAWNLRVPTHMEEAKPFAWGLEGPASLCPMPDGRVLVTEFWGEDKRHHSGR